MKVSRLILIALTNLTTLLAGITSYAQVSVNSADTARLAQFEQSLNALRQQYRIPGLSAAVVSNGRIVWERGFGFADIENQIPATPDTPYPIGGVTQAM
ncbi:MAG: serine hydrolase domain-containing protein, partial [Acidobacteriota bacterium]